MIKKELKNVSKRLVAYFLCLVMIVTLIPAQNTYAASKTKISKCTIKLSKTNYFYSGSACKPKITVKKGKKKLKSGKDYTIKYSNNVNPGTATVTVTGKGKYIGSVKKYFKIKNGLTVSLAKTSYSYSGSAIKPSMTVKSGKKKLTTSNYSVSYKNNVKVGTANIVVKGKGKYKGKNAFITFKIVPKSIPSATLTLSETKKTINVGDNTAYITVNGYREGLEIAVSSSKSELITAGHNGGGKIELYAHDPGSATITVVVDGKKLTCEVTAVMPGGDDPVDPNAPISFIEGAMGNITQYVGEAWGISWNDSFNAKMGLESVDHSKIVYTSDDEKIATVEPMPKFQASIDGVTSFQEGDAYLTFVGAGETTVHAKYVEDKKEYEQTLFVTCYGIDDKYMSVSWNKNVNYESDTSKDTVTGYDFGRKANSVLGQVELEGASPTEYNGPSGFTTYEKDGVLYVFVSDAWNNRIMIYKSEGEKPSILDAMMAEGQKLKEPILVLGQTDASSSTPGYSMDKLCWPMDCDVDSTGRLYVSDTHNGRVQVWDDIVTKIEAKQNGVAADHSISWIVSDHTKRDYHLNWNWAIDIHQEDTDSDGIPDTDKMVVTSSGNSTVCVWNQLPSVWEEEEKYYYPDVLLTIGGSPRTITWTGKQLLIGDENIKGYVNKDGRDCGVHVFNGWITKDHFDGKGIQPTKEYTSNGEKQYWYQSEEIGKLQDFCTLEDYGQGVMINGKLYFGSSMAFHVYNDGIIKQEKGEDRKLQKQLNNAGMTGDTSGWFGYAPALTGGLQEMIYEESTGRLYVMGHFAEGVLCWDNADEAMTNAKQSESMNGTNEYACPFPDYRIRDTYYDYDNKEDSSLVQTLHSPIPSSDGKHLVVLDDFDQKLRVYKNIPTNSGALPDYTYNLLFECGGVDLYTDKETGKTTMMLIARTQNIVYIWNDYKFDGAMPDTIVSKVIGGIPLVRESLCFIEYDGTYTYLRTALNPTEYCVLVYKGIISKTSKPIAYIYGSSKENKDLTMDVYHGQIRSNGTTVSIIPDRYNVMILNTSQFSSGTEENPITLTRDDARLVNKVNIGEEITSTNDLVDGANAGACKENHFNLYTDQSGKQYHMRNRLSGAIDSVITDDGKFIVCDGAEWEVIIWDSIDAAVNGEAPISIIGRSSRETDFDEQAGVFNYHERQFSTYDDSLAIPYYLAYDGTNLWVGEFKFSNRLLRFNLKK